MAEYGPRRRPGADHPPASPARHDRDPAALPPEGHFGPPCPYCSAELVRIPRHFLDRLRSLFGPVHRYYCRTMGCGWEGTVSAVDGEHGTAPADRVGDWAKHA